MKHTTRLGKEWILNARSKYTFSQYEILKKIHARNSLGSDVSNTGNGEQNLKFISKLLKQDYKVEYLDLSCGRLTLKEIEVLAPSLKNNNTLHTLILNNNEIGDEGLTILSKTLARMNLKKLELKDNKISVAGIAKFAGFLAENDSLEHFNCAYNKDMNLAGFVYLCGALINNRKLKYLEIGGNGLGDNGTRLLSKSLTINNSLLKIGLSENYITDFGAIKLVEAIKYHSSLQDIDLSHNLVSSVSIMHFIKFLKNNSTVQNIDLSHNLLENNEIHHPLSNLLSEDSRVKISPYSNNHSSDCMGDCDLDFYPCEM